MAGLDPKESRPRPALEALRPRKVLSAPCIYNAIELDLRRLCVAYRNPQESRNAVFHSRLSLRYVLPTDLESCVPRTPNSADRKVKHRISRPCKNRTYRNKVKIAVSEH